MTILATPRYDPSPLIDGLPLMVRDIQSEFAAQVRIETLNKLGVLLLHFDRALSAGEIRERLSRINSIADFAEDTEIHGSPAHVSLHGSR